MSARIRRNPRWTEGVNVPPRIDAVKVEERGNASVNASKIAIECLIKSRDGSKFPGICARNPSPFNMNMKRRLPAKTHNEWLKRSFPGLRGCTRFV
jgi:hypothetical protein